MELWLGLILGLVALVILWRSWEGTPELLEDLQDISLDPERLRLHGAEIAKSHRVGPRKRTAKSLLKRLDANYNRLAFVYQYLNQKAGEKRELSPASEWILDNYYLIEEQGKETKQRLAQEHFVELPILSRGSMKGYPRIYAIVLELISHTDGRLDNQDLTDFVKAYQEQRVLTMAEIWSISFMMKIALLEYLRHLTDKIYETEIQWDQAHDLAQLEPDVQLNALERLFDNPAGRAHPALIEHLIRELRKGEVEEDTIPLFTWLGQQVLDAGSSLEQLIEQEHFEQAGRKISVGNAIMSLKTISLLDWEEVFESLSRVERILHHDPLAVYPQMDHDSRRYYRNEISFLARKCRVPETRVARVAVGLAKEASSQDDRYRHVGYYLIGNGRKELVSYLGGQERLALFHNYPPSAYYGSVILVMALQLVPLAIYAYRVSGENIFMGFLAAILALMPAEDVAIYLVNRLALRLVSPAHLPKLALKEGIPEEGTTMVVIPSLLPNGKAVKELLGRLETYYLANREENLYFALAGDFKDGKEAGQKEDEEIIQIGLEEVERLNEKYGEEGKKTFFFCQRERTYCPTQDRWTGWERKRGALVEFNRLLLGQQDTTYSTLSPGLVDLADKINYVITLDGDTRLTLDVAKKLIGTMAHPLNRPVIDEKKQIVTQGYGLIQPRIGIGIEGANQSQFTRLFAGQGGIDPYTTAVSDIYQDLFGEGIFTGKGIYDLHVFQQVLDGAIPEGSILSHDLLEGSYIRTGLVTDVKLIDGYPGSYSSFAARQHRWTRGDWQLFPWLFSRVKNGQGEKINNPLSTLSKWKIMDNMRRSLLPIGQLLLIVGGLAWLPGNPLLWLTMALLPMILPLISHFLAALSASQPRFGLQEVKEAFLRGALLLVFLPHQAWLMADGITRTLYRVFFSRKFLLEWTTAADMERALKNDLPGFLRRMASAIGISLVALLLVGISRPEQLVYILPFSLLWLISPRIAFRLSLKEEEIKETLDQEEQQIIRRLARRTWAYYEDFAGEEHNYLPPDNYQVNPPNGVAPRTSPTNIGFLLLSAAAARDFGYLTTGNLINRLRDTLGTMMQMESWRGHLLNWYNTKTLEPLRPFFVSTVDSGNLAGYLLVVEKAVEEYLRRPLWGTEILKGLQDTYYLANPQGEIPWAWEGELPWNLATLKAILREPGEMNFHDEKWGSKFREALADLTGEIEAFIPHEDVLEELKYHGEPESPIYELEELLQLIQGTPSPEELRVAYEKILDLTRLLPSEIQDKVRGELERVLGQVENLLATGQKVIEKLQEFFTQMDFRPLYDENHDLFAIGYNKEEEKLTNSFYDLLASEARLISYLAVCRKEVPKRHWFKLGRALSEVDGEQGLVSWTGTMFEYLMPPLVMKHYPHTLLSHTYATVLAAQQRYGEQRRVPWGTSESGYYAFDFQLNYQYKAFGVPDLGLKRGLIEDMVVSPYSTFLAIPFAPKQVVNNVKRLLDDGLEGEYGLYEAIDYTPERLPQGEKRKVVESFMAHHLGMSLVAMNNFFHDNLMQKRFHSHPIVKSGEILLEERIPAPAVITKDYKEKVEPFAHSQKETVDLVRSVELSRERVLPQCHILSNGRYKILITEKGTGYSQREGVQLTRWRRDSLDDAYGFFIYIKSVETNKVWSATHAPMGGEPDNYLATFSLDKVGFSRVDDLLSTHTEIVVAPEDEVEIRQVTVGNNGPTEVVLEFTSYGEIVLGDQDGDLVHPAFNNLFIKTEALPEENILLASRRPRSRHQEEHWAFHGLLVEGEAVGQLQYETNRGNFLGRQGRVGEPLVLERPLSGTVGTVLDPIFSLRRRIKIQPNQKVTLSWLLGYGDCREKALALARKYRNQEVIERAFVMAKTRSQVETHFLNLTAEEIALYQDLLPHVLFNSPLRRRQKEQITKNQKGQPGLWAYGVSGDRPIVMVTIERKEGMGVVKEILKAHEYWRTKGLEIDLVILNEDKSQYLQPLQDLLRETVAVSHGQYLLDTPGGIFLRHGQSMPEEDRLLLYTAANLVLDSKKPIRSQLREKRKALPAKKYFPQSIPCYQEQEEPLDLQLWNGFGGFNGDGTEYIIRLRAGVTTPAPWLNVIANEDFGFQVSESGAGYTWAENSRENKLTPWSNDPVSDPIGEAIYLRDDDTGVIWSTTPMPIREESTYTIHHGLGYSRFYHHSHDIKQEHTLFVPKEDPIKINLLRLTNTSAEEKNLSLFYYIKPVLGVSSETTGPYLVTDFHEEDGILTVANHFHADFPNRKVFIAASEKINSFTGDRREFLGIGGRLNKPEALSREELSGEIGAGLESCGALQVQITLAPGEEKELVFLLGQAQDDSRIREIVAHYRCPQAAGMTLDEIKSFWQETLSVIRIETPDPTMDLMMNNWLMYQNIVCRLWARSAFYQSGGAYGYRDQLQDSLNAIYTSPEITKNQLLLHAGRQFREGDVLHWWHPGVGDRGVRTRFTDDRLWLPYVLVEYLERTDDYSILQLEAPYLDGEPLPEGIDEKYFTPTLSEEKGTLYDHCLRSLDIALQFGDHGLPLMGSGDWNDGMSTVGNLGRGESVWLGWFLYHILKGFVPICQRMEDYQRSQHYERVARALAEALEQEGWDGGWYRRAYFDDGTPLGSAMNSECSIDSLSQSWSVIAGGLRRDRAEKAMEAVERYLIDRELGLIKLFAPPFEDGDLEPGYIKGYVAGVRENGAQYTHAATWVIKAFAMLGHGDKAWELFHMVNPLNHARTPIECAVYKVEPYVVPADVYTVSPQGGRGGWTWYTGAAGWLYRVGLEDILGFKIKAGKLYIDPCIPKDWPQFRLEYRYGKTVYQILVENPQGVNQGVNEIIVDDNPIGTGGIPLMDDGSHHQIRIILSGAPVPVCVLEESSP